MIIKKFLPDISRVVILLNEKDNEKRMRYYALTYLEGDGYNPEEASRWKKRIFRTNGKGELEISLEEDFETMLSELSEDEVKKIGNGSMKFIPSRPKS